jgi:hypothetical protein
MAMFRQDDVKATIETIRKKEIINQLQVSWYGGH